MTDTKFTKGPWVINIKDKKEWMFEDDQEWEVSSSNSESLFGNTRYYPWVSENIHDAHLIAAAPDLYEALHEWVFGDYDKARGKALMAMSKARGEQ